MRRRSLLALTATALCVFSTTGRAQTYSIYDDAQFTFLDTGPITVPGAVTGTTTISGGAGPSPVLDFLELHVQWTQTVSGANVDAVTGVAGSHVDMDLDARIRPQLGQTGAGNTSTSILWSSLTNWTQTGRLFCQTTCPGGCAQQACVVAFGYEGTGPLPPLKDTTFNLDPWTFSSGNAFFTAAAGGVEFWLITGSTLFAQTLLVSGTLVDVVVPVLEGWGLLVLGLFLLLLSSAFVARRRRS